jgi:hypothetical protein
MEELASKPNVESQPGIQIHDNLCQRSEGFDIPLLDDALIKLLVPNIQSMFKYLNCCYYSESNTKLLDTVSTHFLKALLMYTTNMHSPAMRHLNVKVKLDPRLGNKSTPSFGRIRIYRYIAVTCLLPVIHAFIKYKASSLRSSLQNTTNDDDNEIATQRRRAETRQANILQILLKAISLVVPPIQLYHCVAYMFQRRRFDSPSFVMNYNNLKYGSTNTKRNERDRSINFLYAYRRILYEEFILTMGLLPIDAWKRIPQNMKIFYKRLRIQLNSFFYAKLKRLREESVSLPDGVESAENHKSACTICGMKPIAIPYKSSCGHWSCYACLRLAISDDLCYKCEKCGQKVSSSGPC